MRRLAATLSLLPALAAAQVPAAKVLERYKQMLVANPSEGTALDRLWQAYATEGRSGELLAEFEAQKTYPGQMVLGLLLRKAGRDADAIAALQRALAFDPKNPAPALALGRLELAAGHAPQAVIWFDTAAQSLPDGAQKTDALLQLGAAALAAGDLTRATDAWEKTAALAPDDLALRQQLADTYVRNFLGPRAIPHLEVIERRGSPQDRAQALRQIGAIHQAAGDQDAAIVALERALTFTSPGNWLRLDLERQLIRLHQRYRRTAELEAKWKTFAEGNPRDLGAYLQLIDLYEQLGDQPAQLTWLEKLTALAPKVIDYRVRLARLLVQMDLLDRAATTYDELLGSEPRNIELVFERAKIDVLRDQPDAAGQRIAALLARSGNDEGIRGKALDFFQTHRLHDLAAQHLREDAEHGGDESIVALANFYFSRGNEPEARATLARLVRENDPPAGRAAAHFRVASRYKVRNDVAAATAEVRAAIDLDASVREYHFLLGELEAGAGRYVAAEVAFEQAHALSRTPEEAVAADQRLYDCLRSQKQAGEDEPPGSLPRPDSASAVTSAAAQGYLLKLLRAAVEQPTEERWLRVARWQQWSRNTRGAIDAAERALAVNAESIAAHDFLARLAAADPQAGTAQQHLLELARIDAANSTSYLRRLGQVQLQAGQTAEALDTFRRIVRENPGDLDGLNDLALAQQRSGQWQDSLATLKQLHSLSPAPRKRDVITALLRACDRLKLHSQAAELLFDQLDALPEPERAGLFTDLLAHCARHGLLDWLRTKLEQRQKLRAGDYFTEVALGRVLKTQGNKAAAFEVLADAAFSAPNPGDALPELVREAEELHRLEAAAQLQDRFVRVVPQHGPEAWLRLAELQERSLQPDAAAKTWARIVAKYPRDVQVLEKAVTFERVWGAPEKALALLHRVGAIEPANARALAQLAELSLTAGDPAEAEQCLEQLLAQTEPLTLDAPVQYPDLRPDDPSRLEIAYRSTVRRRRDRPSADALRALQTFWFEKPASKAAAGASSRLETIRQLATLVAAKGDPAALALWVERWRKPEIAASERLWALYFSGASGALLEEIEQLMAAKRDDTSAVNAFVWLALRTGEFDRLGAWNNDRQRTPPERDFLMVAFEQFLAQHHGPVPAELIDKVFPDEHRANLLQAAGALAQHGQLRAAAQLGARVFDRLTTQRADNAVTLAQWHVQLGELDAALAMLRRAIAGNHDSLDFSYLTALRTLYLLLPERERPALVRECAVDDARPVQAALTRLLLSGLASDERSAREQIDRLLALRPMLPAMDGRATAASRRWDFILVTGAQLVNWQLPALASHLWDGALRDEAAIALQVQQPAPEGDAVRARVAEVRTRATALKLMRGTPAEADAALETYSRHTLPDGLLPLAETLEAFGANPLAITIYRRLWALEPANPHALRNAVGACRNAGDWTTMEEILARVVTEGHFKQNTVAQRDLVQQWAEALANRGDLERAHEQLRASIESSPPEARTLMRLAELHERSGRIAEAETALQRALSIEPANVAMRLALAALLDRKGQTSEALAILERASGGEVDARLATLNLKAGRFEEALAALARVPDKDRARITLTMANDLATAGDPERAGLLLRSALGQRHDPKMAFALQSRLLELLPAGTERETVLREIRRLQQFANSDEANVANAYALVQREAGRLGVEREFRKELLHAWDNGRGDIAAGAAWLRWNAAQPQAAAAAWAQLAAHPALDKPALQVALEVFPSDLAVLERFARVDSGDPQRLGAWARALHAAGKKAEARSVAGELAARTVFDPELLVAAAELWLALGDTEQARQCYARAAASDPTGQKAELHFAYARLLQREQRFAEARVELHAVSRNPAVEAAPAILDYLTAAARLDDFEDHLADFALGPAAWSKLRSTIFRAQLERGNLAGALRLAENHASVLEGEGVALLGAAVAKAHAFESTAATMETAVAQGASHLTAALAAVLADWAEDDLVSLQMEPALTRLERAFALQPASWRIAERLAKLRLERNEPKLATRVLHTFLAAASDAAEKDKAQQMLTRIPGA